MDPITKEVYDSIIVIVDRYTKYSTIIPFKEEYNTVQLVYLFLDKVIKIRGFPEEIISDRDKLFISVYWKTITGESVEVERCKLLDYSLCTEVRLCAAPK